MIDNSLKLNNEHNNIIDITISPVKTSELEELASLAAKIYKDTFGDTMSAEDLRSELEEGRSVQYFKNAIFTSKILVAKYNKKIVGYSQFGSVKIPEVQASPDDQELGRLYVDTSMQGRGIGKMLIEAALSETDMAKAPNIYLQVYEENQKAIKLYSSYGFKVVGTTHFKIGSRPAQNLIMKRARVI